MQKCNFIFESTSIVPHSDIQILETTTVNGARNPKVAFKARLQTAEEQNQNGRYYSKSICNEIVNTLLPKAKGRSLFQEVDHPMVDGSSEAGMRRAVIVELKNAGSLVRNLRMDGSHIIAEIETLSGFLGPDMANLILHDKADIGFSLR